MSKQNYNSLPEVERRKDENRKCEERLENFKKGENKLKEFRYGKYLIL